MSNGYAQNNKPRAGCDTGPGDSTRHADVITQAPYPCNIKEIARALGCGKERPTRSGWSTLCPAHDDHNPSLHLSTGEGGKLLVHCHAGCSQRDVLDAIRDKGLPGNAALFTTTSRSSTKSNAKLAANIWGKAIPDDPRILTYLQGRGITLDDVPSALRWGEHKNKQMIVAAVTSPSDTDVVAVHRTYLDSRLQRKERKMLGRCKGRGVWLANPAECMLIGEGIETTLAVMAATGLPGVAALSTSDMRAIRLPEEVSEVVILVDEDENKTGQNAAFALARQLESKGREAWLVSPSPSTFTENPGKLDFNNLDQDEINQRFASKQRPGGISWPPQGGTSDAMTDDEDAPPPEWPALHSDALYGWFGDLVRAATKDSEVDPAAVLLTALTAVGAMLGTGSFLRMGEFKHHPRLFTVLVGQSSRARKGTSAFPVRRVIEAADDILAGEANSIMSPLRVTNGPLSSGEGIIYQVRDASKKKKKNGKPVDLGVSDKRLWIIDGEFAGALKAMQRQGNTLSPILRSAWDHGNISPLTKNNKIEVTGAHICFVSHITGFELQHTLEASDQYNGLANRILWTMCRRTRIVSRPRKMPDDVVISLARHLAAAVKAAANGGELQMSDDALDRWDDLYPGLTADLPGLVGAVTARAEAQVPRLALIYALTDMAGQVGIEHIRAAEATWEYCLASAKYLFSDLSRDPKHQRIIDALDNRPGGMSQTQISTELFSRHLPAKKLKEMLMELEAAGQITRKAEKTRGRNKVVWVRKKRIKRKKRSSGALRSEKRCELSAKKGAHPRGRPLNSHLIRTSFAGGQSPQHTDKTRDHVHNSLNSLNSQDDDVIII